MLAYEDRKGWDNARSYQLENTSPRLEAGRSNRNPWQRELIDIKYFNAITDIDMKTSKHMEQLI